MPFYSLFVQKKCKNVISDPENGCHFPRLRVFEVKFMDKVPLTPNNVPTKFRLNNQIDLEKGAKLLLQIHKKGCHFPRSRSLKVRFTEKVPLAPSNVPTKFCWNSQNTFGEKCKKFISEP